MLSVGNVMGLAWVLIEVDSYCKLCILWVLYSRKSPTEGMLQLLQ